MNAKKLLSTLLSAAMAVSMLAGCFGGGGNKNYSDEAADAANAVGIRTIPTKPPTRPTQRRAPSFSRRTLRSQSPCRTPSRTA